MQVATFLLFILYAGASQITSDCYYGMMDPKVCCEGVPSNQDILLRNSVDCNSYYHCVHEIPMLRPCPEGLHWSVTANRCEFPELAGCDGSFEGRTTERPETTTSFDNSCAPDFPPDSCYTGETTAEECCKYYSDSLEIFLPNPHDCGSYLQCAQGRPVVKQCPHGLQWSVDTKRCEWPNLAKCENQDYTTTSNSVETTSEQLTETTTGKSEGSDCSNSQENDDLDESNCTESGNEESDESQSSEEGSDENESEEDLSYE